MSAPNEPAVPYRVAYSERVRNELRRLLTRAATRGLSRPALQAAKEIDARLRIYPQFGEPLRDMKTGGRTVWIGTGPPLVVQCLLDEANRAVFVVHPFMVLPNGQAQQPGPPAEP